MNSLFTLMDQPCDIAFKKLILMGHDPNAMQKPFCLSLYLTRHFYQGALREKRTKVGIVNFIETVEIIADQNTEKWGTVP